MLRILFTTVLLVIGIILISVGMQEQEAITAMIGGFLIGVYNSLAMTRGE